MALLFWVFCLTVSWCYAGYPLVMLARAARVRRRESAAGPADRNLDVEEPELPLVSVVIAVRNEARHIERRIRNLLDQDYPAELIEVVIVCNSCSDETESIARCIAMLEPRVRVFTSRAGHGKTGALNVGVAGSAGSVLVFADARQRFGPEVLRELVGSLADESIGAVSGMLRIADSPDPAVEGVRLYWGMETALRLAESRTGSVVGATGAIYAVRRRLFEPFPVNLILDDVYLPLRIAMRNQRVILNPRAVAYDISAQDSKHEFARKLRTMVGNLQLLRLMPSLLLPRHNPIAVRYVSHKLLRLLTPVCFVGMVATAFVLPGLFYQAVAVGLLGVYALGGLGLVVPARVLAVPSAFVLIHAAVFMAFLRVRQGAVGVWVAPAAAAGVARPRAPFIPFSRVRARPAAAHQPADLDASIERSVAR